MPDSLHPADELAALRTRIAALRVRHDLLQARLIAADPEDRAGARHLAHVTEEVLRQVEVERLPRLIREDDTFFRTRKVAHLKLTARPVRVPRAGHMTYRAALASRTTDRQSA
ncbi:MAG: hypothetical protein AAFQ51_03420 [Pseudomonadota bacterium]